MPVIPIKFPSLDLNSEAHQRQMLNCSVINLLVESTFLSTHPTVAGESEINQNLLNLFVRQTQEQ
jgi:hypothetical protein